MRATLIALAAIAVPVTAEANFNRVTTEQEFLSHVSGKTLTRPLVKLNVTPRGAIEGTGAGWDVSGEWNWQDGFFCRSLNWGGDDLGYNCQEVSVNGGQIRFRSDKGTGDHADFTLR